MDLKIADPIFGATSDERNLGAAQGARKAVPRPECKNEHRPQLNDTKEEQWHTI